MKTKKQVLDEFARLQKMYIDVLGFVHVKSYKGEDDYWTVEISVTAFKGREIVWKESVEWTHYSRQNEVDEARNAEDVEEFVKRMEERNCKN